MKRAPLIRQESIVVRSGEAVHAEANGNIVMMSLRRGKYYGLDEVGSRIWTLMGTPIQVSGICDTLCSEFDVERERCERDVLAFLANLSRQGLIDVHNDAEPEAST